MVLDLRLPPDTFDVLCLGAHPDDIEIGCGGTILRLAQARPDLRFHWVVLSGDEERAAEARAGAHLFLRGTRHDVTVAGFRDGYFPYVGSDLKDYFEGLKAKLSPELVFTHTRHDRHQDHRTVSDLTWNSFRDQVVLEYEVPKYDGDLGRPNCYVAIDEELAREKVAHLHEAFPSQAGKHWFETETFMGLMRIRGLEAKAASGFAEAFHGHKLLLAP